MNLGDGNETWTEILVGAPLMILAVVLGAIIVRWVLHRVINRVVRLATARTNERLAALPTRAGRILANATGFAHHRQQQRAQTMGALLRSIVTFLVFGVAGLTVMAIVGIPLAPLLASAGVGGLAIGFGAQTLVRDFLSGIFMIIEDQYGVGDVVEAGEVIGTVESVSLRVTRLRDFAGIVWYIRNGEIIRVGNRSQGWSTAIVDVPLASDQPVEPVLPLLRVVAAEMDQDPTWARRLLEPPQLAGVESVTGGVVTVRMIAKCPPTENFAVQRELLQRALAVLDEHDVRLAGPPMHPGAGPAKPA